jgi:hypothetical protein
VTYSNDDEDRAIARALDARLDTGDIDDADIGPETASEREALDEYRIALSHLSIEELPPPPELEERVMTEALARRPSSTTSLDRARLRRRTQIRWAALGAAVVAAAAIVAALLVDTSTTQQPSGSVEAVAVQRSDIDAALAAPDTRTGTFSGTAATGRVALEADGDGFLYDLTVTDSSGRTPWMWLDTVDGTTMRVDELPAGAHEVEFKVEGDVDSVRGIVVSLEEAGVTPEQPSSDTALAALD